ncbi:ABC transporter substrate-binding protein [Chloroflexota bacterium]
MKKKLLTLLIGVSLILALVAVPLMTACAPSAPEAPGVPETPGTPEAPKEPKTVKLGFLAPLTGDVAGWGLPGLYGCEIWADEVNEAGGLQIGDDRYLVEIAAYDDEYSATIAVTGAKKLVLEDEVVLVVQLCEPTTTAAAPIFTEYKIISTTMVASDTHPDYPYLIWPIEISPLTGLAYVSQIAKANPEAKTVAMCDPAGDPMVLMHNAFALAAFETAGIEVVYNKLYDGAAIDVAPVMTAMLATNPDIICWEASYPYHTHLLIEQAQIQGFEGPMAGCTLDMYSELVERVGKEYMEGATFCYPDHDDPMLTPEQNAFYAKYNELYPGTWSGVSWEYVDNMKFWAKYAQKTGSVDPMTVLSAMKADPNPTNSFGSAKWVGKELWGIDNSLMGAWPVVEIQNGKAVIVEMVDLAELYYDNVDRVTKYLEEYDLMWYP